MKISKQQLKKIISEEIQKISEADPLAGKTATQSQPSQDPNDALAGKTAAPEQAQQQAVSPNAILNIKKQLQALVAEIDKVIQ
jgi:hypothetical protein